jgi:hypothetical protein
MPTVSTMASAMGQHVSRRKRKKKKRPQGGEEAGEREGVSMGAETITIKMMPAMRWEMPAIAIHREETDSGSLVSLLANGRLQMR